MRYIKLGHTGLDVSPIAIGAMTYGEPNRGHPIWSLDEASSRPLIQHAIDVGIGRFRYGQHVLARLEHLRVDYLDLCQRKVSSKVSLSPKSSGESGLST
jgi:hypothetical protein